VGGNEPVRRSGFPRETAASEQNRKNPQETVVAARWIGRVLAWFGDWAIKNQDALVFCQDPSDAKGEKSVQRPKALYLCAYIFLSLNFLSFFNFLLENTYA